MELLLKEKANVDAQRKNGKTPLMDASENGYLEVSKTLLKWKATIDAASKKGKPPLLFMFVLERVQI